MAGRVARGFRCSIRSGVAAEWPELIWRFIELATDHGGRATFYQVRGESLPLYLDAGLRAFKLGEYAYVPLQSFTIKGSKRAHLRQAINRGEREDWSSRIAQPTEVPALLPELRAVSDAWLEEHETREKGFSLGTFEPAYVVAATVRLGAAARAIGRVRQSAVHAGRRTRPAST